LRRGRPGGGFFYFPLKRGWGVSVLLLNMPTHPGLHTSPYRYSSQEERATPLKEGKKHLKLAQTYAKASVGKQKLRKNG